MAAWLATAAGVVHAADLTPVENRWLKGAWPVVTWAKQAALPVDIVVQPQDAPGAAPLSMAFVDGRCKLVLSMRGNAEAQATLDRLPDALRDGGIQLMAAHELAHCHRRVDGAWNQIPTGVPVERAPDVLEPELKSAWMDMKATRREEGYADLVGLAWIQAHRPQDYAGLHDWLVAERSQDRIPGSHHDTLAWVRLVPKGAEFPTTALSAADAGFFDGATALWTQGLALPD
jgi:hypothetical protein